MLAMPDQPNMTLVPEQSGSTHWHCVYNFLFMLQVISEHTFCSYLLVIHSFLICGILFISNFYSLSFPLSVSVVFVDINPGAWNPPRGLGAVFWNADLWGCHHSSMSWVSALAPQPHSPIHALWWHALFLSDSSGQPESCPVLFPLLTFLAKKEAVGCFMLRSVNHIDVVSAFFTFSLLFHILSVRHVMVMQMTCASCTVYFCPVTLCFPVFPFFTELCLQLLYAGFAASNRSKWQASEKWHQSRSHMPL